MATVSSRKFNNVQPSISIPLNVINSGVPLGTAFCGGLFYTFSGKRTGAELACTRRKKSISSELNLSPSTVWRAMSTLQKNNFITAVEEKRDTYIFNDTESEFVRLPSELLKETYQITYKNGAVETRTLTHAEAIVGGLIITRCDNFKKKRKSFTTSNAEIADELNLSLPTVQAAIEALVGAKIIFRNDTGINRYKKSNYGVHRKFIRRKKAQKVEVKEKADVKVVVYKTEAEARAERLAEEQREYYARRLAAEERAEENYKKALKDDEFREADEYIRAMGCKLAFAELNESPEYSELKEEFERFERQRAEALARLGIKEEDLSAKEEEE